MNAAGSSLLPFVLESRQSPGFGFRLFSFSLLPFVYSAASQLKLASRSRPLTCWNDHQPEKLSPVHRPGGDPTRINPVRLDTGRDFFDRLMRVKGRPATNEVAAGLLHGLE